MTKIDIQKGKVQRNAFENGGGFGHRSGDMNVPGTEPIQNELGLQCDEKIVFQNQNMVQLSIGGGQYGVS